MWKFIHVCYMRCVVCVIGRQYRLFRMESTNIEKEGGGVRIYFSFSLSLRAFPYNTVRYVILANMHEVEDIYTFSVRLGVLCRSGRTVVG